MTPLVLFTIGHSTRSIEEFIRLLKAHGVGRVIDVRNWFLRLNAFQLRPKRV